jgi:hypothetical protein
LKNDKIKTIGVMDKRGLDTIKIKEAYKNIEKSLREVGRLLRVTEAGKFMWSSDHKSAVTGLRIVIEKLRYDVPDYEVEIEETE